MTGNRSKIVRIIEIAQTRREQARHPRARRREGRPGPLAEDARPSVEPVQGAGVGEAMAR
jgi:hypothetical protein